MLAAAAAAAEERLVVAAADVDAVVAVAEALVLAQTAVTRLARAVVVPKDPR